MKAMARSIWLGLSLLNACARVATTAIPNAGQNSSVNVVTNPTVSTPALAQTSSSWQLNGFTLAFDTKTATNC